MILYPLITSYLIVLSLYFAKLFIVLPNERKLINKSKDIFDKTKSIKIAVAGSYGKTTMKELLAIVLAESGKVAATPGNKNVSFSHAYFAKKLIGDEKFIIVEFGEGKPGDVDRFTKTIKPDYAVITGIAPAHLDKYPSVEAAANDIFSLDKHVAKDKLFINGESEYVDKHILSGNNVYTRSGVGDWKVSDVVVDITGTKFKLRNSKQTINVSSQLLGKHQIETNLNSVKVVKS